MTTDLKDPVGRRSRGTTISGDRLFLAVGAAGIASYAVVALQRVNYPYELAYFEGSTIEVTARLVEGQTLYGPPSPEFTSWPYPPMYFWATALASKIFGLSLPTMRWTSIAASIVVLVLIALIVRKLTRSTSAGVLAAGLYASTYRVAGAWADTARIDSLFLAFTLAVVLAAMLAKTWRGGVVVGLLVVAAFLTKQNALLAAAPLLLTLVIVRRQAGVAAISVATIGAVSSVVVGDLVTGGWYSPYVVRQLLGHDVVPMWLIWFWVVDVFLPVALTACITVWLLRRNGASVRAFRTMNDNALIVGAAVVGLLAAGLAGRLHQGGSSNVAMPTHVAMAIVIALGMWWLMQKTPTSRRLVPVLGLALVVQFAAVQLWRIDVIPTAQDRAEGDRFIADIAGRPGPVIVPSHPYYARLAGQAPTASAIAVADLLASQPNRARNALEADLPWSLAEVNTVVLDSPANAAALGQELVDDFTLVNSDLVPGEAFVPVSDFPTKPTLLYIRTTELNP